MRACLPLRGEDGLHCLRALAPVSRQDSVCRRASGFGNHGRKAGAHAYLRAKKNPEDSFGIVFELVDSQGGLATVDDNTSTVTSLSSRYKNVLLDREFDTIRQEIELPDIAPSGA